MKNVHMKYNVLHLYKSKDEINSSVDLKYSLGVK